MRPVIAKILDVTMAGILGFFVGAGFTLFAWLAFAFYLDSRYGSEAGQQAMAILISTPVIGLVFGVVFGIVAYRRASARTHTTNNHGLQRK